MRKTIDFLKTHPLITGIIAITIGVMATRVFKSDDISKILLLRILLTMAMSMFVYLISGEKTFEKCHTTTGYVVKWGLLTLIFSALLFIFLIVSVVTGHSPLVDGWYYKALMAVLLAVFVGLFEELTFRATFNDALLYTFRNSKHIFVWIAVISSFVFGVVHVISPTMFSQEAIAGTILKTVSTALAGFCFMILYWKTRNIWGVAIVHGMDDLTSFLQAALTEEKAKLGGADTYADVGTAGIVSYVIIIILSLIAAIIIWKKVGKTIDFEEIRQTW